MHKITTFITSYFIITVSNSHFYPWTLALQTSWNRCNNAVWSRVVRDNFLIRLRALYAYRNFYFNSNSRKLQIKTIFCVEQSPKTFLCFLILFSFTQYSNFHANYNFRNQFFSSFSNGNSVTLGIKISLPQLAQNIYYTSTQIKIFQNDSYKNWFHSSCRKIIMIYLLVKLWWLQINLYPIFRKKISILISGQ